MVLSNHSGWIVLVFVVAVFGLAATAPSQAVRSELAELRRVATGRDVEQSLQAINKLVQLGDPARADLLNVLDVQMRKHERLADTAIRLARSTDASAAAQRQLDEQRTAALALIEVLKEDQTLAQAHENYRKLKKQYDQLKPLYEKQLAAIESMATWMKYRKVWLDVTSEQERAAEKTGPIPLPQRFEQALGLSWQAASEVLDFERGRNSTDPWALALWHHAASQRIETYNARHIQRAMSAGEWENAKFVNEYRRMLGALPYELDERLIQSARRHSKDMVERGYFSHDSPNAAGKSPGDRMTNAGYDKPRSENIAAGSGSGELVFWMWFDSPGHHRNMVHPTSIALGVGQWNDHWTQNMGVGDRLLLMDDAQRKAVKIKGDLVPAQR